MEYCDQFVCLFVCLSVCVSVCPQAYFWNRWTDLHQFCGDPLWPWLGPPLAALRYQFISTIYLSPLVDINWRACRQTRPNTLPSHIRRLRWNKWTLMMSSMLQCSDVDFMGPEGLQPPPIFEPWGSCNISVPSIIDKRDNINHHKLAALQQRRKITNSFNSSLNANDIAAL